MNIQQLANQLKDSIDTQQAQAIFQQYLTTFHFRHFAFTYYSGHVRTGRKLRYHCVSPALRTWHLHYIEQGYADIDRTLEKNHHDTLPILWDVHEQLAQSKNRREQRMRKDSISFGIHKGLSVPLHGPNNDFVSLTLHQCRGETTLVHYEIHQNEWISATYLFYHHIRRLLMQNETAVIPANYKLTRREEQCLTLTAQSWRVENIAKELKISPRTVNFHIQNANKKLGTNNKYQAVNRILIES